LHICTLHVYAIASPWSPSIMVDAMAFNDVRRRRYSTNRF